MSVIGRALRLSSRERRDAARALGWLVVVHAGLRLLPYRRVRAFVTGVSPRGPAISPEACGLAVARASVLFPRAQCLARALAAECLLKRAGRASELKIGVGFDEAHVFEAHAWLVSDGVVVTGGGEQPRLKEL
ncbi:MAG TPA: lasso peptide biosynthesis B2 protein [Vicinamibacterales bacterium]